MKELNPSYITMRCTSTNRKGQVTKDVSINCGTLIVTDGRVGIINDPVVTKRAIDGQYDVLLGLAGKGYTLLLVGEDMLDSDDELFSRLVASEQFTVCIQPDNRVKRNRVKGSFLPGTQGQGPRDKWGKPK